MQYVEHGWPVTRLAVPRGGRCSCRLLGCPEPHLVLNSPGLITTRREAEQAFAEPRWDIALVTASFDVIEVPPQFGAPLHHLLKTSCPTALAPAYRRWQFYMAPGSVPRGLIEAAGGVVFSSSSGWVAAPGTTTETTGTIRWLVPPYLTNWRPHQRRDHIDTVFGTVDWSASTAPAPCLPRIVEEALE
jgi:hypothetical protein